MVLAVFFARLIAVDFKAYATLGTGSMALGLLPSTSGRARSQRAIRRKGLVLSVFPITQVTGVGEAAVQAAIAVDVVPSYVVAATR